MQLLMEEEIIVDPPPRWHVIFIFKPLPFSWLLIYWKASDPNNLYKKENSDINPSFYLNCPRVSINL